MVAGKPPFSGENPVSIAYKQVHDLPQPLNQLVADVPRPFEAIVAKLLAKDPNMRYANAEALRDDLRRYRSGEPVLALAGVSAPRLPPPRTGDTGSAANVTRAMPRTVANPAQATTVMARSAMMPPAAARSRRNNWYGIAAFIALLALVAGGIVLFNVLKNDDEAAASFAARRRRRSCQLDEADDEAGGRRPGVQQDRAADTRVPPRAPSCSTDPIAGTIVTTGQAIDVYYNPIKAPVPIPDVTGMTVEEATSCADRRRLHRVARHRTSWSIRHSSPARC